MTKLNIVVLKNIIYINIQILSYVLYNNIVVAIINLLDKIYG